MGYVHCMPALVVQMSHGLDNVVGGMVDVDGRRMAFRTRGHIVKAVNKIYRGNPWKPSAGARVLLDGELRGDDLLVDHVEADAHDGTAAFAFSPHLDAIAELLPTHPPATKTLRVWRGETGTRIRFADIASRRDQRGRVVEEILHANHATEGWHLWRIARDGGSHVGTGIDAAVLTILARAAGRGSLTGETAAEEDRRQQAEMREAALARVPERAPPPDDDCPF